ncbi:hypothetical protein DRJ22_00115 [Candidatus Woesearchaeota archaeon]|nr:MAG: hypothetical protein DRJ22_00115 [Candidatus Woesearchaeota archaeon]
MKVRAEQTTLKDIFKEGEKGKREIQDRLKARERTIIFLTGLLAEPRAIEKLAKQTGIELTNREKTKLTIPVLIKNQVTIAQTLIKESIEKLKRGSIGTQIKQELEKEKSFWENLKIIAQELEAKIKQPSRETEEITEIEQIRKILQQLKVQIEIINTFIPKTEKEITILKN